MMTITLKQLKEKKRIMNINKAVISCQLIAAISIMSTKNTIDKTNLLAMKKVVSKKFQFKRTERIQKMSQAGMKIQLLMSMVMRMCNSWVNMPKCKELTHNIYSIQMITLEMTKNIQVTFLQTQTRVMMITR